MRGRHRRLLPLLLAASAAVAQEPGLDEVLEGFETLPEQGAVPSSLEDILEGFEDGAPPVTEATPLVRREKDWQLSGSLAESAVYFVGEPTSPSPANLHGLERLRTKLNLQLDANLSRDWQARIGGYLYGDLAYTINSRDDYTEEVLDEFEQEAELGEAWLRGRLSPRLDLKVGRQLVVWGKSENLRVTDVLNPLDAREPGIVDIEDLRLPLAMTRADYYRGDWNLSLLAIHEVRFDKRAPFGSAFYPAPVPPLPERIPDDAGDNTEFAAAANGIFSGWDLSLYWARVHDDRPHVIAGAGSPFLAHNRTTMLGTAVNVARGNWLLKGEAAHFSDLRYAGAADSKRRTDLLLGAEYAGFAEASLSLEIVDRHVHAHQAGMEVDADTLQTAVRYQQDFRHDTLHLVGLNTLTDLGEGGGFSRISLAYDIRDALTVTGGTVLYHGGDSVPFTTIGDSDLVFAELRYSF